MRTPAATTTGWIAVWLLSWATASAQPYDPLALPHDEKNTRTEDLIVRDAARQRDIPLRVYLPGTTGAAPVVLFSHGLGGTREGCDYLGKHWSARGYAAVFVQHPGSDDSVWRSKPPGERMAAMNEAASARNFLLRVGDVPVVLDQLGAWNAEEGHVLRGRLDTSRVGMSGHSFGAVTTQAVSGQSFGVAGRRFTDKRIRAAIAMSPSSPRRGEPGAAFGSVGVAWMLLTGTNDVALIGGADAASRLKVYPNLPDSIDKYELVLDGAEHSAFSDRALPGDREPRNPNHHRAILALSTAFWDTYLRQDPAARAWLEGDGPRRVLEPRDRWRAHVVTYDAGNSRLMDMPLAPVGGKIRLQVLVDRPSIEVCGNDGRVYQTQAMPRAGEIDRIAVFADGAPVRLDSLEVYELNSIWSNGRVDFSPPRPGKADSGKAD